MAYTTIDDGSAHFQTLLYSGNASSSRALTNDGNSDLQPDWVWIKERTSTSAHKLLDSTRGVGKALGSNTTNAEESFAFLSSFDSDGFTIGTSDGSTNASGDTYVAWQWKANGGTTSSNSNGSITSTVQANTTAGFSIVTYTGGGSATTVGHGLGKVPSLIILKRRDSTNSWLVKHQNSTSNKNLQLHTTNAELTTSDFTGGIIGDLSSSTVFSTVAGSSGVVNVSSSNDFIAYCFTSIKGYSKFGSYTGNGNADGPFVYTGFKPAFTLIKRTNSAQAWVLHDSARAGDINPTDNYSYANATNVEAEDIDHDYLSNGFKIRATFNDTNASGGTYIYLAFAEHPFVSSKGVPVTAR